VGPYGNFNLIDGMPLGHLHHHQYKARRATIFDLILFAGCFEITIEAPRRSWT
jgi:hypothetical protein